MATQMYDIPELSFDSDDDVTDESGNSKEKEDRSDGIFLNVPPNYVSRRPTPYQDAYMHMYAQPRFTGNIISIKQKEFKSTGNIQDEFQSVTSETGRESSILFDLELSDDDYMNDDLSDSFQKTKESTPEVQECDQKVYLDMCYKIGILPTRAVLDGLAGNKIIVENVILAEPGTKALCVSLLENITVETLRLHNNDIGPEGIKLLAPIVKKSCYITYLKITNNRIGSTGAKVICDAILENQYINTLDLSGNGFYEADAHHFARLLLENKVITSIRLSHNTFREEGASVLAKVLAQNETLVDLDLSWNHIRRRGAKAMCDALKVNWFLKKVNLSWNGFGMEGSKRLAQVFLKNTTLKELDISSNRIDKKCLGLFLPALVKNTGLHCIRLGMNSLTTDGCTELLDALGKSKVSQIKVLDLGRSNVDHAFLRLEAKLKEEKGLEVIHGIPLRYESLIGNEKDTLMDYDPMMVLMEFMRLKNLRLLDLFQALDTDQSKSLTYREFRQGLKKENIPLSGLAISRLLKQLDRDSNGEVEWSELMEGQREHKKRLLALKRKNKKKKYEDTELGKLSKKLIELVKEREKKQKAKVEEKVKAARDEGTRGGLQSAGKTRTSKGAHKKKTEHA